MLVLTTWSYRDGLIQAATLPYLRILSGITGGDIYLVCWEQDKLKMTDEEFDDERRKLSASRIHLLRIPYRKNKLLAILTWLLEMVRLVALIYRKKVSYLHAFCMPAGSVAYFIRMFKKMTLIIDSMEPHADMMMETGVWAPDAMVYKISARLEKKVAHAADYLIAVSKKIRPYLQERYALDPPPGKLRYRPLCIEPGLFKRAVPDYSLIGWAGRQAGTIAIYTGKFGGMYYDVEFCRVILACIRFWKNDFHLIVCTSMDRSEVASFLVENGIAEQFFTITFVNHAAIPAYLSLADFGISASRPSKARQYGCPTKNAEYWSVGLPVLTTDAILDDRDDIDRNPFLGAVLPGSGQADLTGTLRQLDALITDNAGSQKAIRGFALANRSFEIAKKVYEDIYG